VHVGSYVPSICSSLIIRLRCHPKPQFIDERRTFGRTLKALDIQAPRAAMRAIGGAAACCFICLSFGHSYIVTVFPSAVQGRIGGIIPRGISQNWGEISQGAGALDRGCSRRGGWLQSGTGRSRFGRKPAWPRSDPATRVAFRSAHLAAK